MRPRAQPFLWKWVLLAWEWKIISMKAEHLTSFWYIGLGELSLRSKRFRLVSERRKTEEQDSRFWPCEKWNKSQKMKVGGGGGEGRKRLRTNSSILKTCVRQRTQRLIGSASRTMLTCVDQRFVSYWEDGMVRDTSRIYSINRPGRLLNFWTLIVGAYSRLGAY